MLADLRNLVAAACTLRRLRDEEIVNFREKNLAKYSTALSEPQKLQANDILPEPRRGCCLETRPHSRRHTAAAHPAPDVLAGLLRGHLNTSAALAVQRQVLITNRQLIQKVQFSLEIQTRGIIVPVEQ